MGWKQPIVNDLCTYREFGERLPRGETQAEAVNEVRLESAKLERGEKRNRSSLPHLTLC